MRDVSDNFTIIPERKPNWVYNYHKCNGCGVVDNIIQDESIIKEKLLRLKIKKIKKNVLRSPREHV